MPNTHNSSLSGENRISVDIVDRDLNIVGPGPLLSCISLDCDTVLSRAGNFTARFPANDERLQYLQLKKHYLDFYLDDEIIFYGLAEAWSREINDDGQHILVVTGRDTLALLTETAIGRFHLDEDDDPVFNAPERILLYDVIPGWALGGNFTTLTGVYGDFIGEDALSALTRIAEHIGESFRLNFRAGVWWINSSESSPFRAVQSVGDPIEAEDSSYICFIQRMTERRDASRVITKIYPYGSGLGETRLDLAGTTRTAPTGFTLDEGENSISSNAALAYVGSTIGRHVNFKDIRPLFNTDADIISAKNYLFDAALAYLKRNDSIDDVVDYELDVVSLPPRLLCGMTLRVVYQDDVFDLDRDMIVLGIRRNIATDGVVRYGLTVANTNQWRLRETNSSVAQLEEGEIFAGHPQIDANTYWENFREEVGDDQTEHIAEMPFVLSEEVVTIRQVLFRYKVDRLLSAVGLVSYANPNTASGGATVTGIQAAGTTDLGGTANTGLQAAGTTDSGGGGTSGVQAAGTTDNQGAGTTGIQAAGTTDSGGGSTTGIQAAGTTNVDGSTLATGIQAPGNTDFTTVTAVGSQHDHNHTQTHSHTTPSHSHVISQTHSHSTPSHSHVISQTHSHTTPNHTHVISQTHSHSTPNHQHVMSATHSHTVGTHTHVISQTHSHTMATHVHAAPALVVTWGLRRTPALNSYVQSDLEYSVNGGAWAGLETGIPVAGGYYEVDVTSSIQNPNGMRRPYQHDNLIQVRRKTAAGTGKTAMIRVKLNIRATIQSIAQYS